MNEKPITTRYPIDLLAEIKQRAQQNERSFNSEVIHELRHYRIWTSQQEKQRCITDEDLAGPGPTIEEAWRRYTTK